MDFREIRAKTILTRCRIPGIDYVINPYIGCRFACKYCYASFMGRFVGKTIFDWGEYVYAKINAPELLNEELSKKLKDKTYTLSFRAKRSEESQSDPETSSG